MLCIKRVFIAGIALILSKLIFILLEYPIEIDTYKTWFWLSYISFFFLSLVMYELIYPYKIYIDDNEVSIQRFFMKKSFKRKDIEFRLNNKPFMSEVYLNNKLNGKKIKKVNENMYDNFEALRMFCL